MDPSEARVQRWEAGWSRRAVVGIVSLMRSEQRQLLMLIADISGYTKLLMRHGKALAHGQMVVGELLRVLLEEVQPPFEVSRLEGDAVIVFAPYDEAAGAPPPDAADLIDRWLTAFHTTLADLAQNTICRCPACGNIAELDLKIVGHSGSALIADVGRFTELHGVDVIVTFRLLKNTVDAAGYVLLSEAASAGQPFGDRLTFSPHTEDYDDVGPVRCQLARTHGYGVSNEPAEARSSFPWDVLRHEIRAEYGEVADNPTKGFHFHTGEPLARRLGYVEDDILAAPAAALASFAGTGNPHAIAEIPPGANVVDIGCGAGFDTFIASRRCGETGHVIGVDMTPEMVAKARSWADDHDNINIRLGFAEELPVDDAWADCVISNGVLNLCPDKPTVLAEIHRVLKPGGSLFLGDVLVRKAVPEKAKRDIDLWAG
jgi:2-polyprenyl-3-methyl-5-hydroxy-6-metoxy-1,4-benzoquinol methylase